MYFPQDKFQCTFDSMYAFPPQIEPIFKTLVHNLADKFEQSALLAATPFSNGIMLTFVVGPKEDLKSKGNKIDKESKLWIWVRVSGDLLWDAADNNYMDKEVHRIVKAVLLPLFTKHHLNTAFLETEDFL